MIIYYERPSNEKRRYASSRQLWPTILYDTEWRRPRERSWQSAAAALREIGSRKRPIGREWHIGIWEQRKESPSTEGSAGRAVLHQVPDRPRRTVARSLSSHSARRMYAVLRRRSTSWCSRMRLVLRAQWGAHLLPSLYVVVPRIIQRRYRHLMSISLQPHQNCAYINNIVRWRMCSAQADDDMQCSEIFHIFQSVLAIKCWWYGITCSWRHCRRVASASCIMYIPHFRNQVPLSMMSEKAIRIPIAFRLYSISMLSTFQFQLKLRTS